MEGVAAIGHGLAHHHGPNLRSLADDQGVAQTLHELVKPQGVASTLDADGHRAGQRAVELLDAVALMDEFLIGHFPGIRVKDGKLLLPGVQITSDECHESGLLLGSRVTVPQPSPINGGRPFS